MKQPVILLALGSYQHDTHRGVARYAREQGWHLVAEMAYGGIIPKGWEGDGIITALTERDEPLANPVRRTSELEHETLETLPYPFLGEEGAHPSPHSR